MPDPAALKQDIGTFQIGAAVSTQARVIQRGNFFSVRVQLENTGEQPVTLTGVSWSLPPGLEFNSEVQDEGLKDILEERRRLELRPGDSYALIFHLKANSAIRAIFDALLLRGGMSTAPARTGATV